MMNYLTLNIGPSNAGKTRAAILPQLFETIETGTSFVALDSKNTILPYVGNMLIQSGYNILTFDIRNTSQSHCWNPLSLPYQLYKSNNIEQCYHILNDLASDIFINSNDYFWESSAKDLFVGLCILLFSESTDINQINLRSIYYIAVTGFQKFASSTFMQEYINMKGERFSLLASSIQTTLEAANDTRQGILSTFYQSLREFTVNDTVVSILSGNDISIEDIIKKKTALFLNYEDENPQSAKILNVLVMQIYRSLVAKHCVGLDKSSFYSFFFDDFLALPKFTRIDSLLLGHKSRNISLTFSINNINLFTKIYGKETTAAILSNADCINAFYDIAQEYNEFITNRKYQNDLLSLSSDRMLRITLNTIEHLDIKSVIITCDEEKLYRHNYRRQHNNAISYYDFNKFVEELKRNDYEDHMKKMSKNLNSNSNLSLDMLLDFLTEFPRH